MAQLLRTPISSNKLLLRISAIFLGFFCWSKLILLQRYYVKTSHDICLYTNNQIAATDNNHCSSKTVIPEKISMVHYTSLPSLMKEHGILAIKSSENKDKDYYEPKEYL